MASATLNPAAPSSSFSRLAGPVMTAGAALGAIGYLMTSFTPSKPTPASVASPAFVAGSLLVYLGSALVLLTLPAMMSLQYERSRKLTLIGGIGLILTMLIQGISNTFGNITLFKMLIDNPATRAAATGNPPAILGAFFIIAMLASVAGALVLGIGVLRAKVYPKWVGILMIVTAVAGPVAGGGPAVLQNAAPILGSIALIGVGFRLFAAMSASTPVEDKAFAAA
jgi:hypothetical protein